MAAVFEKSPTVNGWKLSTARYYVVDGNQNSGEKTHHRLDGAKTLVKNGISTGPWDPQLVDAGFLNYQQYFSALRENHFPALNRRGWFFWKHPFSGAIC